MMNGSLNTIGTSAWMTPELEGFRDAVRRFVGSEIVPNPAIAVPTPNAKDR